MLLRNYNKAVHSEDFLENLLLYLLLPQSADAAKTYHINYYTRGEAATEVPV